MKKIPTLFERVFVGPKIAGVIENITPGCEEAFLHGIATVKFDGSCCAIINGQLYKRYDAKKGKKVPEGAIPCCEPDPVTGHHPHWVKVDPNNPSDKWFSEAFKNFLDKEGWRPDQIPDWNDNDTRFDGTYEAVGPHFQGNPYGLSRDELVRHGSLRVNMLLRTFNNIKLYLENTPVEGIVFWLDGEPVCKIKRTDFGLEWPIKEV